MLSDNSLLNVIHAVLALVCGVSAQGVPFSLLLACSKSLMFMQCWLWFLAVLALVACR